MTWLKRLLCLHGFLTHTLGPEYEDRWTYQPFPYLDDSITNVTYDTNRCCSRCFMVVTVASRGEMLIDGVLST